MMHVYEKKAYPETFDQAQADAWMEKIRAEVKAKGWKIVKDEQWQGPTSAIYNTIEAEDTNVST